MEFGAWEINFKSHPDASNKGKKVRDTSEDCEFFKILR
jgi:hypothetical protein